MDRTVQLGALWARSRAEAETQGETARGRGQSRGTPEGDAPIQAAERLNGARALSKPAGCGHQPGTITGTAVGRGEEMAGVASVRVWPGRTQDSNVTDPRGHRGSLTAAPLTPRHVGGPDTSSVALDIVLPLIMLALCPCVPRQQITGGSVTCL